MCGTKHMRIKKLVIKKEGKTYIAGDPSTGTYIGLDHVGVQVLRSLQKNPMQKVSQQFPDMDVKRFVAELKANGLVTSSQQHTQTYHLPSLIRRQHVAWLFSAQTLTVLIVFFVLALDAVVTEPSLFPKPGDIFFTGSALWLLFSFVIGWCLIAIHELGHYLAAISEGVSARFSLSTQLLFLVAVTDVSNLYAVAPKKRYKVLLAGMCTDLFLFSACIVMLQYAPAHFLHHGWSIALLKLIILFEFLGLLWQTFTFMQTDLYYVLETAIGVHNLHAQTITFLKGLMQRKKSVFTFTIERSVLFSYSLFSIVGCAVVIWMFVRYSFPVLYSLLLLHLNNLYHAVVVGVNPAKSVVTLVILAVSLLLYCVGLLNHHGDASHPARFSFFFSLLWVVVTGMLFLFAVAALPFMHIGIVFIPLVAGFGLWAIVIAELHKMFSETQGLLFFLSCILAFVSAFVQYTFFSLLHVPYLFSALAFFGSLLGMIAACLLLVQLDTTTVDKGQLFQRILRFVALLQRNLRIPS